MPKLIKSNSEIYKGSVVLADPLTMPQVREIEKVLDFSVIEDKKDGRKIWTSVVDENMLPAILACVETWELENFPKTVTLEAFPASPRKESHELVKWLFAEIYKVYIGETTLPNG